MEAVPPLPELPPSLQGSLPGCRWAHCVGVVGLDESRDLRDADARLLLGVVGVREGQGGAAPGEQQ